MKKSRKRTPMQINTDIPAYAYPQPQPLTIAEVRHRYAPPQTLGTPEEVRMACDAQLESAGVYSLLQHSLSMGQMPISSFLGYGTLQQISQNGVIRACIQTVADDMTRSWIDIVRKGDQQDSSADPESIFRKAMGIEDTEEKEGDKISRLTTELETRKIQALLHDAETLVGYMGGAFIFIDTGETDPTRLKQPLNISPQSLELQPDRPLRFVLVDPINCFPGIYNSNNPLREDYFVPKTWWVLSQEIHSSRLIRLVANEVPALLKPAYNFLGIAQAQLLWDYVLHFQECRIASQRLLSKFSLTVMKTDMTNVLTQANGYEQLDRRIALLVQHRSNDGVQVIDKEAEDIVKLETPISGVTDIVRQSMEILAAMNRTPAVKLLGISPSGFNATGESDLRNYYDYILSQQEKILRPALTTILKILQIKLFGDIDKTISFDFSQLSEEDQTAKATTQKLKADTMTALLNMQVVSPEECRQVLADDPDSGFGNITVNDIPDAPIMPMEEINEDPAANSF